VGVGSDAATAGHDYLDAQHRLIAGRLRVLVDPILGLRPFWVCIRKKAPI